MEETETKETEPQPRLALVVNKANLGIRTLVEKAADSRYALKAVNITPTHTEVTDGIVAARVSLPPIPVEKLPVIEDCLVTERDDVKPFSIGLEDAKLIELSIPKHKTLGILNNAQIAVGQNGTARFATTNLDRTEDNHLIAPVFSAKKIEGQFPELDFILKSLKKPKLTVGIDAEKLIDVLKAAVAVKRHAHNKRIPVYVRLSFVDANSVIKIEVENEETTQDFLGLLMPVRL